MKKHIKLLKFIRFLFPVMLPVGAKDFDKFCSDIFMVYNLPDMPSYRHAIASMVMNLGPTKAFKAPMYFALSVKKAMANQVAYQMIQDLRQQEKEQRSEAAPAKGTSSPDESIPNKEV